MGVDPTKLIAATSGLSSSASTASLSPCSTLKTPSGRPASFHSCAIHSEAEGSFSLGLRTTALPAAMATGKNHIGHHGREVEGADDPDHAERLAQRVHVDAGGGLRAVPALEQVAETAGELDDLLAAGHLAQRVGVHLAVLGGDERRELVLAGVEQLAEGEHHLRTTRQGRRAPGRRGPGGGGDDPLGVVAPRQRHLAAHLSGRGVGHVRGALGGACEPGSVHPVLDHVGHGAPSSGSLSPFPPETAKAPDGS